MASLPLFFPFTSSSTPLLTPSHPSSTLSSMPTILPSLPSLSSASSRHRNAPRGRSYYMLVTRTPVTRIFWLLTVSWHPDSVMTCPLTPQLVTTWAVHHSKGAVSMLPSLLRLIVHSSRWTSVGQATHTHTHTSPNLYNLGRKSPKIRSVLWHNSKKRRFNWESSIHVFFIKHKWLLVDTSCALILPSALSCLSSEFSSVPPSVSTHDDFTRTIYYLGQPFLS